MQKDAVRNSTNFMEQNKRTRGGHLLTLHIDLQQIQMQEWLRNQVNQECCDIPHHSGYAPRRRLHETVMAN